MNIENYLKKSKISYLRTEPSEKFLAQGWNDLENKINNLERPHPNFIYSFIRPIAFAVMAFFIVGGAFAGLAQASQRSLPGEPLYPVKRLSEEIISTTSGNNLIKVDNRAKEIVGLAQKHDRNEDNLNRTIKEYREEVEKISKSGKSAQEFEKVLESHEKEFEEVRDDRSGSDSGEDIDEAIKISKSGRGGGD